MKSKVLQTIEKYNMLAFGDRVIVALSGGADSVSLLHILISLKEKYNLSISAAHLNHMLRGEESVRDLNFVKNLCNNLKIPLFVKEVDIESLAQKNKQSTELCGREERYKFFEELSKSQNAKIATAHTASDNLETLIYNISRGTSLNGLKGIVPKRNYIIRPLIEVTRREIENYCLKNNIQYVNDSTNSSDDYTRNKIRHNVVPVLKNINVSVENAAAELTDDVAEINSFLEEYTRNKLNDILISKNGNCFYDSERLKDLPPVIQKQAVFIIFKSLNIKNISRKHINLCLDIISKGGEVDLNSQYKAVCRQGMFRIIKTQNGTASFSPYELKAEMCFEFSDKEYKITETNLWNTSDKNILDFSLISKKPVFRLRQAGDYIKLPRRNVKKSLKKFMIEEKIPKENRDSLMLLADGSRVLWLEGFGVSGDALISGTPTKVLKIQINALNVDKNNDFV